MPTVYGFNDKQDARFAKKVARERRLQHKNQFGFEDDPYGDLTSRVFVVTPLANINPVTTSDGGTTWDMQSGTCQVRLRGRNTSEYWSQEPGNTITAKTLVRATNRGGSFFYKRVFNPTLQVAAAGLPALAVQDSAGDLYLINTTPQTSIVSVGNPGKTARNVTIAPYLHTSGIYYHSGYMKTFNPVSGLLVEGNPCWIMFLDNFDMLLGKAVATEGNHYGPAQYGGDITIDGDTFPMFMTHRGDEQYFVKVNHPSASDGEIVETDSGGFIDGKIVSSSSQTDVQQIDRGDCVIVFNDFNADADSTIITQQGKIFGPCKQVIAHTTTGDVEYPVFEVTAGEQELHGKCASDLAKGESGEFEIFDYSDPPVGTGILVDACNSAYNEYEHDKFARIHRDFGGRIANQVEL